MLEDKKWMCIEYFVGIGMWGNTWDVNQQGRIEHDLKYCGIVQQKLY